MKKLLLLVALLLGLVISARAQSISQVSPILRNGNLTTTTCTGTSLAQTGCVGINMGGYKVVTVSLQGSWTGTVTFEISLDGTNFVVQNMLPNNGTQTAVTTATANGIWVTQMPITAQAFRARFSTASSGTVNVFVRGSF